MSKLFDSLIARPISAAISRLSQESEIEAIALLAPAADARVLVIGSDTKALVKRLAARVSSGQAFSAPISSAPDRAFDGALAVNSLHLCKPIEATAAQLARVLKPGAKLVSLTPDWLAAEHAASAQFWIVQTSVAFAKAGFTDIRALPAKSEKGHSILFEATRA